MSSQEIELEVQTEPTVQSATHPEVKIKHYEYVYNGRPFKITRKYTVKNSDSFKTADNKKILEKYVEEHKQKYIDLPKHKRVSTLIKDVKEELNIKLSCTGSQTLLVQFGIKEETRANYKQKTQSSNQEAEPVKE